MSFLKKAQQQIAHNTVAPSLMGNSDLKSLQAVITSEKEFMKNNSKTGADFGKNVEAIKNWGNEQGEDLRDVLSKVSVLWETYPSSVQRFNSHLSTIRLHFKAVRTREEMLAELKSRKRSLASKIESVEKKLAKMSPENKELMKTTSTLKELRNEMRGLTHEVVVEEAGLEDFKRRSFKDALGLKCSAVVEIAEKMIVMAEMAGAMLEELDLEQSVPGQPRRVYQGESRTEGILQDGIRCLADVAFRPINCPTTGGPGDAAAAAAIGRPSHLQHRFSASEVTTGPYPSLTCPPTGAAVSATGDAAHDAYDYGGTLGSKNNNINNINGYADTQSNWDPQMNAFFGVDRPVDEYKQQQQQEASASTVHASPATWNASSGAGPGPTAPAQHSTAAADANAADWGRQALGAISGAGQDAQEERSVSARVADPATGVGAGADAGSTDAHLTPETGASAVLASSSSAQQQPGHQAPSTAVNDSRDSMEELNKDYGRITTGGVPIIANDTSSRSTPAPSYDTSTDPGTAPKPLSQGNSDSALAGGASVAATTATTAAGTAAAYESGVHSFAPQPQGAARSASAPRPAQSDEESLHEYFKSVGSTRAAQQAVRRPGSAQGGATSSAMLARYGAYMGSSPLAGAGAGTGAADASYNSNPSAVSTAAAGAAAPGTNHSSNGGPTLPPPAPSSGTATFPAEDTNNVKKVTASAFRKGFSRTTSSQGNLNYTPGTGGGAGSRPGSAAGFPSADVVPNNASATAVSNVGVGTIAVPLGSQQQVEGAGTGTLSAPNADTSGMSTSQSSVAPLHINKRASQDMSRTETILSQASGNTDAAPPYTSGFTEAAQQGQGQAQGSRADHPHAHSVYGGMAPPPASPGGYADPNAPGPGQYGAPSQQSYQRPSSPAVAQGAVGGYPFAASAGAVPGGGYPAVAPGQPAQPYGYGYPGAPVQPAQGGGYGGYADPYATYGQQGAQQGRYSSPYAQR
ncbi:hypothetical protein K437DRAFT_271928 [Tilletiaria anomala UBC 951]|uniref:Uncharacterized protein n=1 Tax=Tilletiaria anomala (strain ATCC 24038 / CBS 436.72 / UBC 951) TaxID=1037660 RepID=A0A066WR72_TILAU|nr:uncharacterized protein K437DRAFT_271928 [Tilletiaria anomala UBC 951]KDN53145.1 hypothetical protein K437DRAFT_271928 [Tilletiaria anomala UBC 951]